MRYLFFIVCIGCFAPFLKGQEADTIYLDEVEIPSGLEKYTQGMLVSGPDSVQLLQYEGNSLGTLIQENTGIYIRRYGGEGQLSTLSFRGTTPNHTVVSWNGIDINSQTLGQTDFSSVPVFHFSDIELYHGASSVLFGSGAIGGTVNLKSQLLNRKGLHLVASQHFGSFGKNFSGLKASYGHERLSFYVTSSYSQIDNNFEVQFRNQTYEQNNAASMLWAVSGGGSYQLDSISRLDLEVWYNVHDRQAQPIIGNPSASDELLNRNLRTYLNYQQAMKSGFVKASLAYVADRQTYNESSQTNLDRYHAAAEYEFSAVKSLILNAGGDVSLALPEVSNYAGDTSQLRGGVYLLSKWNPFKALAISTNLRQPFLSGVKAPVVPSLGFNISVLEKGNSQLAVTAQTARAFRFPTLNDLFWQPGGNPDLKPEDGFSAETGIKHNYKKASFSSEAKATIYRSNITDMIIWVPNGTFWYPNNVREVKIKGFEALVSLRGKFFGCRWHGNINYSYNQSQNHSKLNDQDRSKGKQLAYVPFHKAALSFGLNYRTWTLAYSQSFTGKRFTEATNTAELESFTVADISIGKSFQIRDHKITLGFEANNLWDAEYQNYEMRATPGRNYLIRLNYHLTKSKL